MEAIQAWAKNIILIVMAISFIDLILPSGEMKKYIQFVFSLMILAVIISPVTSFVQPDLGVFQSETLMSDQTIVTEKPEMKRVQTRQISQVLSEKTSREVKDLILEQFPDITVVSVEIYINENTLDAGYSEIQGVFIVADRPEMAKSIQEIVSTHLQIDEVRIAVKTPNEGGTS